MENSKETKNNTSKEVIKKQNVDETPRPLFEDLSGHKHDDASYKKLMQEQSNRNKENTKNGI